MEINVQTNEEDSDAIDFVTVTASGTLQGMDLLSKVMPSPSANGEKPSATPLREAARLFHEMAELCGVENTTPILDWTAQLLNLLADGTKKAEAIKLIRSMVECGPRDGKLMIETVPAFSGGTTILPLDTQSSQR